MSDFVLHFRLSTCLSCFVQVMRPDFHDVGTAGWQPLHHACDRRAEKRVVIAVLRGGADPFLPSPAGETPLQICELADAAQGALPEDPTLTKVVRQDPKNREARTVLAVFPLRGASLPRASPKTSRTAASGIAVPAAVMRSSKASMMVGMTDALRICTSSSGCSGGAGSSVWESPLAGSSLP